MSHDVAEDREGEREQRKEREETEVRDRGCELSALVFRVALPRPHDVIELWALAPNAAKSPLDELRRERRHAEHIPRARSRSTRGAERELAQRPPDAVVAVLVELERADVEPGFVVSKLVVRPLQRDPRHVVRDGDVRVVREVQGPLEGTAA